MRRFNTHLALLLVSLLTLLSISVLVQGCLYFRLEPTPVDPQEIKREKNVLSPVKAHLVDGSVVVFPEGATLQKDRIYGKGQFSDFEHPVENVGSVAMDSVVALESFSLKVRVPESLIGSAFALGGSAIGTAAMFIAIFGSCPTVYTGAGTDAVLESELFSNSISARFEKREVDVLGIQPDTSGLIELDIRNEALETHYINQLELLEVVHDTTGYALPGPADEPYVLSNSSIAPLHMTDRTGRDVLPLLAHADDRHYATSPAVLEAVQLDDLFDFIDIAIPTPVSDTAGLHLRLRNSLLSTVYFYEFMLARQGPRALDWLANDLNDMDVLAPMLQWYRQRTGLRVEVLQAGAYREVARIPELGPIAWDHVAIPIPVHRGEGDTLHVRLRFIADDWRIDRVGIAGTIESASALRHVPAAVHDAGGKPVSEWADLLRDADQDWMITTPGNRFKVTYRVAPVSAAAARTFMLAGTGYYTEWIRKDWMLDNFPGQAYSASDTTLLAALHRWREVKDDFEVRFHSSKIPVR